MSANILLVTDADDTFRKPLLESQGYQVQMAVAGDAISAIGEARFHLALISTESGVQETQDLCAKLRRADPALRIAVIAQRSEYFSAGESVEVVIREQHSPGRFLAAVKKLLDGDGKFSVADGEGA